MAEATTMCECGGGPYVSITTGHVHSVRQAFGTDIIVTRNVVTNDKGEVVQETFTTLAGRTGDDGEEGGFSDGTA